MEQREYLLQRYRSMETEELVELKVASLTEVATEALNAVFAERGISPGKRQEIAAALRAQGETEASRVAEAERIKGEKSKKRDAFIFKVMLVIGIPLIILGALFQPEKTFETLVSTVVQALIFGLLSWAVFAFRQSRSKKP